MRSFNNKVNTVYGKVLMVVSECKLLFANMPFTILSTELFCDDILANLPYRVTECERIELFDPTIIPRMMVSHFSAPVAAALVYGRCDGGYRFITNGTSSPTEYAAVALSLFYRGRISAGECVSIISDFGALSAVVTDDGVLLFG